MRTIEAGKAIKKIIEVDKKENANDDIRLHVLCGSSVQVNDLWTTLAHSRELSEQIEFHYADICDNNRTERIANIINNCDPKKRLIIVNTTVIGMKDGSKVFYENRLLQDLKQLSDAVQNRQHPHTYFLTGQNDFRVLSKVRALHVAILLEKDD